MTINAREYIENGFSQEDADKMLPVIEKAVKTLAPGDTIIIDFSGVEYFTTLFFNQSLTYLLNTGKLGKERYEKIIVPRNLSASGEETYQHARDYAINYYALNADNRKQLDDETCELIE